MVVWLMKGKVERLVAVAVFKEGKRVLLWDTRKVDGGGGEVFACR